MSRRARLRQRQDHKRQPIPDPPDWLEALAQDRAKREQTNPKGPQ